MPVTHIQPIPSEPIFNGELDEVSDMIFERLGCRPTGISSPVLVRKGSDFSVKGVVAFDGIVKSANVPMCERDRVHSFPHGRRCRAHSDVYVYEILFDVE